MIKINVKLFFKNTIENLESDWPGGSYLVLKINYMVLRDRVIIDIDYKYNTQKVLSLIYTEDSGIKNFGTTYL